MGSCHEWLKSVGDELPRTREQQVQRPWGKDRPGTQQGWQTEVYSKCRY